MYVLANREFDRFTVLFFEKLTSEDFHPPSPGSKGKARMNKVKAFKKCKALWGNIWVRNEAEIEKINKSLDEVQIERNVRLGDIQLRIESSTRALARMNTLKRIYKNEKSRYNKKLKALKERKTYWQDLSPSYSFDLLPIENEKEN